MDSEENSYFMYTKRIFPRIIEAETCILREADVVYMVLCSGLDRKGGGVDHPIAIDCAKTLVFGST